MQTLVCLNVTKYVITLYGLWYKQDYCTWGEGGGLIYIPADAIESIG